MLERKRYNDLQEQYLETRRRMKEREEEMIRGRETGELIVEK